MTNSPLTPGIVPGRLPAEAYRQNFADHEPALQPFAAARTPAAVTPVPAGQKKPAGQMACIVFAARMGQK